MSVRHLSSRFLLPPLSLFMGGKSEGQNSVKYRFQLYDEEDGRIDVESHYLDLKYEISERTRLGLRFAVDSLSGMTPTGTHASVTDEAFLSGEKLPEEWNYATIEDERVVSVFTIDHEIGDHTLSFEYARSEEEDYLSNAVTAKIRSELFQKNTTVTAGLSLAFDEVLAARGTNLLEDRNKDTFDLSLGLSQLLSPQTILDITLGYGRSEGYLADPYRSISEVFSRRGSVRTINWVENRPDEQDRWVAKIAGRHYFPELDAALSGSYRFFSNSDDLEGHTYEVKWSQQVSEKLSVTPYFRYYQQSSADYYQPSLTGTGIFGHGRNDGVGPFYSSDYRLAALNSVTYGVRLSYEPREDLAFELQYERYEMDGRNERTPDEFFPSANVFSAGVQWEF